ncbi:MAG: M23 family metallopeptidase [Campylobacterales bacterium]|nr:M23 family metallopeptidase [Campylobacterales bacterium]
MGIVIGVIGVILFVVFSPSFERDVPSVTVEHNGYWNLKSPLKVRINDQSGIGGYRVALEANGESISLAQAQNAVALPELLLSVEAPKKVAAFKPESVKLIVEAHDTSSWNFFRGNTARVELSLIVDTKAPQVSTVAHSMYVHKGGSGMVVFAAEDPNLDSLYIEIEGGKRFVAQPFYKEGYFISLVAWPLTSDGFSARLIATDKAGNLHKSTVPFRVSDRTYQLSKLKLSDAFLEGKIAELAELFEITHESDKRLDQFRLINERVREKNEKLIHELTSVVSSERIDTFEITPFYPLKNGQKVASFGDHRLYFYNEEQVSESYHLGLDLASVQMGAIMSQNAGTVVFSDFNGIYGTMPVIDHGLGLYTLYGHCSSAAVQKGDKIHPGDKIANTGMSGYAMGDHLHFGVLVQGIEVRPEEWMDAKWIKLNITDTISDAKKIIDRK